MSDGADLLPALRRLGLVGADEPGDDGADRRRVVGYLAGRRRQRVSSASSALAKLKVAADWRPGFRNASEVAGSRRRAPWCRTAPDILGHDPDSGLFAMAWLPPDRYRLWKAMLRDGDADAADAAAVGRTVGRIHAATAGDADVAARFATDDVFMPIQLDAYLLATGRAHPDLGPRMQALVEHAGRQPRWCTATSARRTS
ncbi:MAG: hypothetical protein R3F55_20595 [Alphaproteobacteria bacterium]